MLIGLAFADITGGAIAGVAVSVVYVAVRFATLGGLPPGEFVAAAVARVLLYVGLGVGGGAANRMLAQALRKLELYDEIDDTTGVGNARALLGVVDREVARADRYHSVFSFAIVRLPRGIFDAVRTRAAERALRRVCQTVEGSTRTTDLVARVPLQEREDLVVVLTETSRAGAQQLLDRLVVGTRTILGEHGIHVNGEVTGTIFSYPGDDATLLAYRDELAAIVAVDGVDAEERP